jgi:hypothetical protein
MPPFDQSLPRTPETLPRIQGRIINISDISVAEFRMIGPTGGGDVHVSDQCAIYMKGDEVPIRYGGIDAEIIRRHLKRFAAETPTPPAEWVDQYLAIVADAGTTEWTIERRPDDGTHRPRDEGGGPPPIGPPW